MGDEVDDEDMEAEVREQLYDDDFLILDEEDDDDDELLQDSMT